MHWYSAHCRYYMIWYHMMYHVWCTMYVPCDTVHFEPHQPLPFLTFSHKPNSEKQKSAHETTFIPFYSSNFLLRWYTKSVKTEVFCEKGVISISCWTEIINTFGNCKMILCYSWLMPDYCLALNLLYISKRYRR